MRYYFFAKAIRRFFANKSNAKIITIAICTQIIQKVEHKQFIYEYMQIHSKAILYEIKLEKKYYDIHIKFINSDEIDNCMFLGIV